MSIATASTPAKLFFAQRLPKEPSRLAWSRERRGSGKAEHLPRGGQPALRGDIPGARDDGGAGAVRGGVLRAGDMENRIKEQQLALFADRTSAQTLRANQLRLYFASFAYTLVVFQFVSVDFTKLFHELVRSLFELVHYCRRELGPGKGPVEPYVSVKLATVTLSCSSELIHKIPRPCIGII